jgi:hypothetical protein
MNAELLTFAARLQFAVNRQIPDHDFNALALELFVLQFRHNPAYQIVCEARRLTPDIVEHWTQIPHVPTAAFKELELSSIPPKARTAVFHSSGTTEQKPSRHFHCAESLRIYEASLWPWFEENIIEPQTNYELLILTPPPRLAPHSSLIHMFEIVRHKLGAPESSFVGQMARDGTWLLDFEAVLVALNRAEKPKLILGTAFSFVHLLDFLIEKNLHFHLPPGTRVMETGGYKNRSRTLPKAELHSLISEFLGVPRANIICEYGMSELSSQAYDFKGPERVFHFPSWARAQVVSPETGREVADGQTGLIRIFDLANVFSIAAVQTEDLAVRHGDCFALMGRASLAEARGCSLMTAG